MIDTIYPAQVGADIIIYSTQREGVNTSGVRLKTGIGRIGQGWYGHWPRKCDNDIQMLTFRLTLLFFFFTL